MTAAPGFYGKVYTHGDFVERRLPGEFVAAWDGWLRQSIAASREQLGEGWLDCYLNSPIWRFGLSPGLCGPGAWAGVLTPSVDKVGRHYPLTLAVPLQETGDLPHLFASGEGAAWFAKLADLALSCCLDDDFDLEAFDRRLQACLPPRFAPVAAAPPATAAFACRIAMDGLEQLPAAFLDLGAALMQHYLPPYSLWSSLSGGAALLLLQGLPPVSAYAALLAGPGRDSGWPADSRRLRLPVAAADNKTRPLAARPFWRSFALSVRGGREVNEDACLQRPEAGLWAVADGMGGHLSGEAASQAVAAALAGVAPSADLPGFAAAAEQALQAVNRELRRQAKQAGPEQIIGSTVVALLALDSRCVCLWAGDSRLYRFRGERLEQLTEDHAMDVEMARKGLLTEEQLAEVGRHSAPLTRAVGAADSLALASRECDALPGDYYLLCSDGLDKALPLADIEAVLQQTPPEQIAATLLREAEARGAQDNVTVVLAVFAA